MRKKYLLVLIVLLFAFGRLIADTLTAVSIQGPSAVSTNLDYTYNLVTSSTYVTPTWVVTGGTLVDASDGAPYWVIVNWTTPGTGSLTFKNGTTTIATFSTTITSIPNPVPVTSISYTSTCKQTIVTRNSNPPSGYDWYWMTSPLNTGTTLGSTASVTRTTGSDIWLRARATAAPNAWSHDALLVHVTIDMGPAAPAVPTISTNTCGPKILFKNGSPPAGVSWYWQGTNSSGQDYTSASATGATYSASVNGTVTYYITARNDAAACWGGTSSVSVTADNPPAPVAPPTYNFCEWDAMTISASNYLSNLKWYNVSGQLLYTGINYTPTNLDLGNYTYYAKNIDAAGCESTTLTPVALNVNTCDNLVNWNQATVYGINTDGTPKAVAASIEYYDGLGNTLQSQVKSFATNQVFASQSIFDNRNNQTLTSLPAPINSSNFGYHYRFITNNSNQKYSANDFDASNTTNAPNPVGNNGIGSLGWYYSTANTLEPNTPITSYPYSRTLVEDGPDPKTAKSAGPGDAYKMGSGHEVSSVRQTFVKSELNHYFALRSYFVTTALPVSVNNGTNLISNPDATSLTGYTASSTSVTLSTVSQNGETYIKATAPTVTTSVGITPIGGNITVTPGATYVFKVKGYRTTASPVSLYVKNVTGNTNIVWPGSTLPSEISEDWVENTFTVPPGCTSIALGVLCAPASVVNDLFFINAVSLTQINTAETTVYGYKSITTDPDGKKSVSFTDADGHTLATAIITNGNTVPSLYDYWSYTYYNDMGQVVATVAPNGVKTDKTDPPAFVTTYKYDHLGRLIETSSPDEGTSQFVYSMDGKLKFSQNNDQRNSGALPQRFSYSNYDKQGRLIESGEYTTNNKSTDYFFEPQTNGSPTGNSVLLLVDNVGFINLTQSIPAQATHISDYSIVEYDIQTTLPSGDSYHSQQNNLTGQVARTQNTNATTWYSYDEFGQLEWSKQSLPDLGYKTVDYNYDYLGNITQVVYQKGQTDKFYHFYTYNDDQKLTEVYTSLDGTNKVLQAKYYYYLHGPLKRVELANNLQGIDYTYTLQGALKSINHMDVTNDPGADGGTTGSHTGFSKDVFGLTLSYFDNDFASGGHNAGNISPSGSVNSYSGTLKSVGWFTPVDNTPAKRAYSFTYDNVNQLQNALWGTVTGTGGSYTTTLAPSAYKEGIGSVANDKNGNIQSMQRNERSGVSMGNYTYVYETGTNKLDKVNDGGTLLVDYTYNSIGQMIQYTEAGKTITVNYNAQGLVKQVLNGTTLVETFMYDDRGNRIQKINYSNTGAVTKTTYYVNDASGNVLAVYEQKGSNPAASTTPPTEVPVYGSSRLGTYKPGKTTFYELNDHLGNVRAVIGAPYTETTTATMESDGTTATDEDKKFKNIAPRTVFASANHTTGGNEAIFVNNARPVGPTKILPVSPGDVITITTYAYYEGGTGYSSTTASTVIASAIETAFGGVNGAPGDPGRIFNALNSVFTGGGFAGLSGSGNDNVPAAYLNMIMFDGNMLSDPTTLPMSAVPVTNAANMHQQLITIGPITIPSPGYIYVYVNNNSNSANRVYFDDLSITQLHSPFVAGGDFYPYGLEMKDRQITIEPYRYGYQGQYSEKDSVTGWNNFELRMYEPRFGRWLSPDPYGQYASPYIGMGNVPNEGSDPDGGLCCDGLEGVALEYALANSIQYSVQMTDRAALSLAWSAA
ncbi:MAG TPA: RHS repeat-associated core domain-containing protein, partial [Cyclobacteriaceae bacterium]